MGFDMASISGSEKLNIPVLNKNEYLAHLLSVGDNLKAKSKIPTAPKLLSAGEIDSLRQGKLEVEAQLSQTRQFSEKLESQYKNLRRHHRQLDLRRADLVFQTGHWELLFERKLQLITQNILHHEQLADLLLQQLQQRLSDDYNNHAFHLRNEFLAGSSFDDTVALGELERLRKEKDALETELLDCLQAQNEAVREEVAKNKLLLAEMADKRAVLVESLRTAEFSAKRDWELASRSLDSVSRLVELLEHEKVQLQLKISHFHHNMHNALTIHAGLKAELSHHRHKLEAARQRNAGLQRQRQAARDAHSHAAKKQKNYIHVHSVLENAIFSLQGPSRKYLLAPEDEESSEYTKVFSEKSTLQLHVALFAEQVLFAENVAVLFSGGSLLTETAAFVDAHLKEKQHQLQAKGWHFSSYFQSAPDMDFSVAAKSETPGSSPAIKLTVEVAGRGARCVLFLDSLEVAFRYNWKHVEVVC